MSLRVFITGATGFAGRHLVARLRGRGRRRHRRAAVGDGRPARPRRRARAGRATRGPDVVYHLAARAHVGQSWEDPLGTLRRQRRDDRERARGGAPRGARRGRRLGRLGRGVRAAGHACRRPRTTPLRPQNPYAVSKASSALRRAASTPTPTACAWIHARAFNHAGPGPGADLRDRQLRRAVRARAWTPASDPIRDRHRQPRHPPRLHRRPRRRPRLPAARRPRRAGRVQRLLRRLALRPRADRRASARSPASPVDHEVDPAKVRAHEVLEVRGSADRLHAATGWQPEIPLEQTLADTLAWWRTRPLTYA